MGKRMSQDKSFEKASSNQREEWIPPTLTCRTPVGGLTLGGVKAQMGGADSVGDGITSYKNSS